MRYFFYYLIIVLICTSCLEKITLKKQEFSTKALVIQGKLVKGNTSSLIEVLIQRIGDFASSERETIITTAKVDLLDETDNVLEIVYRNNFGYYLVIPQNSIFKVTEGKKYSLRVTMPDGKKYISNLEVLNDVPKPKLIWPSKGKTTFLDRNSIVQEREVIRFNIQTAITPTIGNDKIRLKWEPYITYKLTDDTKRVCYTTIPQTPEKIRIFDPIESNVNFIDSFQVVETNFDERFAEASYLTIVQESLSETAFTYWNQIRLLSERTGNMFEAPAATISTNIRAITDTSESVYGLFYATKHDTLRYYVDTNIVGSMKKYCPQPPTDRIGPTICDNCLLISRSTTTTKPFFFR